MTSIIAFRLQADSAVALRAAAELRGLPVSQFIREAINRELKLTAPLADSVKTKNGD